MFAINQPGSTILVTSGQFQYTLAKCYSTMVRCYQNSAICFSSLSVGEINYVFKNAHNGTAFVNTRLTDIRRLVDMISIKQDTNFVFMGHSTERMLMAIDHTATP